MVCPSTHRPAKSTVSHHAKRYFLATISTTQRVVSIRTFVWPSKRKNAVDWLYTESSVNSSLYVFLMDRILFYIL